MNWQCWNGWDGAGWSPWWGGAMLLFWGLLIAGVVLLLMTFLRRGPSSASTPTATGDSALAILQERFAKGEIGQEEFERMRHTLT